MIEPFIPQALLLARCRLVMSHGGAGTMFGALGHGLPQLLLPLGADQFWNAAACQEVTAAARGVQAEINTMPTAADALAGLLTTGRENASANPPNAVSWAK